MVATHIRVVAQRASRKRYWREADARTLLAAVADSGLSLSDFAREFGIHAKRIERWQKRLALPARRIANHGATPITFQPIEVVMDEPTERGLELVLRNGRRIAIHGEFDPNVLERLVRAVEGLPC